MRLTVGTHNLHDETGTPTGFADVILFTEAIPARVVEALGVSYVVKSCRWQRDLVIAWRRSLGVEFLGHRYRLVHIGIPLVTPHRGTWTVKLRIKGKRIKVPIEHRINAAFPPFKRGEAILRPRWWGKHAAITERIVERAIAGGWEVIAGGDLNTPPHVLGYPADLNLSEQRKGLDRIATTGRIPAGAVQVLGRVGSDHPRLKVEVVL